VDAVRAGAKTLATTEFASNNRDDCVTEYQQQAASNDRIASKSNFTMHTIFYLLVKDI
jgi:hypothetical protein